MENKTEYIGKVKLDYQYYGGRDLYVDGSEEELLDIVKMHTKSEYNRVIEARKSCPIFVEIS